MVDDVSPGALVRAKVVMRAEVNIHLPVFELFPGQGQWMAAAVAKENSTKQIIPMHPGRTAMFCPDFFCLLKGLTADDWLMGVGNDYTDFVGSSQPFVSVKPIPGLQTIS